MNAIVSLFQNHRKAIAISTIAFAVFCLISLVNHWNFRTYALDLGLYTNALWDYAHGTMANTSLFLPEHKILLTDHFDLYLILFSPLSYLFDAYTLLVVQMAAVIFGGVGFYKLLSSREETAAFKHTGLFFFYFFFGTLAAVAYDYHSNVISAMMLPWFFLAVWQQKFLRAGLWLLLMFIGKENVSLFLVFVNLGLFFKFWKQKNFRIPLLAFTALSAFYFLLMVKVVMPKLAGGADFVHFGKYPVLGGDMKSAVLFMLQHPFDFLKLLFVNHLDDPTYNYEKVWFYAVLFVAGGWALFFRPYYLLMIVPIIIQKELTNQPSTWGCVYQYSIELVPIIGLALFEVFGKGTIRYSPKLIGLIVVLTITGSSLFALSERAKPWEKARFTFWQKKHFHPDVDLASAKSLINLIPSDAAVMANSAFVGQLAYRDKCYALPLENDAEYVLLSTKESSYPISPNELRALIRAKQSDSTWQQLAMQDSVFLFKRIP